MPGLAGVGALGPRWPKFQTRTLNSPQAQTGLVDIHINRCKLCVCECVNATTHRKVHTGCGMVAWFTSPSSGPPCGTGSVLHPHVPTKFGGDTMVRLRLGGGAEGTAHRNYLRKVLGEGRHIHMRKYNSGRREEKKGTNRIRLRKPFTEGRRLRKHTSMNVEENSLGKTTQVF